MDIANIKPAERIVEILHPGTGEETGVKVTLVSLMDPKTKNFRRRMVNQRLELESKGKKFKAEDVEENELNLLFDSMTGWEWGNDNTFHGEKPTFNIKNVKQVFTELEWFKNQVAEAIADEQAFFQNSKPVLSKP